MTDVRVFSYWTGPQSPLISLCLKSLARNCYVSECWTHGRFKAEYDGLLGPWERIASLRPNLQSDVLRAWLLYTYGGIWIDADCIVFRDLRPLYQHLTDGADILAYKSKGTVFSALMGSKPRGEVIRNYCRRIKKRLTESTPRHFQALGPNVFKASLLAKPTAQRHWVPMRLIHPVRWMMHGQPNLLSDSPERFDPAAYGLMLVHREIAKHGEQTEAEWMDDQTIIGFALRKALA